MERQTKTLLQWHSAFYAGIQIEFEEEAQHLLFENEHMLGTRPMQIDILVIKKNSKRSINKNIGRIFKKHNIVEYKSPEDYLSVDDFYKVLGYACFYKADAKKVNEVKAEEVTISYVCSRYPKSVIHHCKDALHLKIEKKENGIYYIIGERFPMQILVTTELSEKNNLWLKSLTNKLKDSASAEKLVREYEKHQKENLYISVMEIIVRANAEKFDEVKKMCDALRELMKDEFEAIRQEVMIQGRAEGISEGLAEGILQGRAEGISQGLAEGLAEGRAEGRAEGSQQKIEELILKKIIKNKSIEQIADELESEVDEILLTYQKLKKQAV